MGSVKLPSLPMQPTAADAGEAPPLPEPHSVATQVLWNLSPLAKPPPERTELPRVRGYEILSVIGAGAMGIVYQARHRDLRRIVALKTIRSSALANADSLERFYAEAEAVARLQHPNIIQVFDVGTVECAPGEPASPSPFIALEYVDGGSLSQLTATPQTAQRAAELVELLARAADAAHRLGVIHRDLKPANVLLTRDGEPKIADFGLAKQLEAERDAAGRFLTQAGMVMGTPEYMAPEQVTSSAATPALDIYALGVILYELLTARVPFQAATPVETLNLTLFQDPVPPRRLQPSVPRDLDTICLKCLEKMPHKRYASAAALADDLERFLEGRTIQARPAGAVERALRWSRRNPLAALLTAAVIVVAFAGLAGIVWQWQSAVAQAHAAGVATGEARDHARNERWERYRADIVAAAAALRLDNVSSARPRLEGAPLEHRGWEWQHYQSRLDLAQEVHRASVQGVKTVHYSTDGLRVVLEAGTDLAVWDLASRRELFAIKCQQDALHARLSPDGRLLAYRPTNTEVVLYDIDANCSRCVLGPHGDMVRTLHFTADGQQILTCADDYWLRTWTTADGKQLRAIPLEKHEPLGVAFSPDGRCMSSGALFDTTVRILDTTTGKVRTELVGHEFLALSRHEHTQFSTRFEPTGKRLITIETYPSNTMRLWEAPSGRMVSLMKGHTNTVTQIAFSPDGTTIATGSRDLTVRLWNAATGEQRAVLRGHRGWVLTSAFSPDGKRLITGAEDQSLRLWDAATGAPLNLLHGHTAAVQAVAYAADGQSASSVANDGTIRLWNTQAIENSGVLRGHKTFVYGVACHPDGRRIASASWDGTARIWDADSGRELHRLDHGEKAIVTAVAFDPTGKLLATRARDAVRLWDADSGRELQHWNRPSDWWRDTRLAFSPDGRFLATGCQQGSVCIWDVATRKEAALLHGQRDEIRDVVFSPHGQWLVAAGEQGDRSLRVWDVAKQVQIQELTGHGNAVYSAAFNRAGSLLASSSLDGTVRLWDTQTWQQVGVLPHGVKVYSVAFTHDGARLVAACATGTIRIWDVKTRKEVAELIGHEDYVHQVAFSPDGTRLVSGSGDGTIRIWDSLSAQERARK